MNLYKEMKKYQVKAESVEDFLQRYLKDKGKGEEYVKAVAESKHEEIKKYGFAAISRYDSNTGEVVTYYG